MAARRVWITWETQRRNVELAAAFGARLIQLEYSKYPPIVRYLISIVRTLKHLFGGYQVVFVQSPSLVLAFLAAVIKPLGRYRLVIDAHNSSIECAANVGALSKLSRVALAKADFVIVSNSGLVSVINSLGGHGLVLPDKLPQVSSYPIPKLIAGKVRPVITLIATFADDEPIREFLEGASEVQANYTLYVTGRRERARDLLQFEGPKCVFTDYLIGADYEALIQHSDLLVDLTIRENCLVCGAYEAVAVGVPIMLSDTTALKNHFTGAAIFSANSPLAYKKGIEDFITSAKLKSDRIEQFRSTFTENWEKSFATASQAIFSDSRYLG